MLVDTVRIKLLAGKGGDGVVSWRHEKHVPRGGPDGGDGGKGGDIILSSTHNLNTLSSFKYRKIFAAGDGANGMSKKMTGHGGADLELLVPTGTIVRNDETGEVIFDFDKDYQKKKIVTGGIGGKGNVHFVSAQHQNPFECTQGKPGESIDVSLELKLVADVAFVGLPNAGKSSLLYAMTGAQGRIAGYPFSTTEPMLGALSHNQSKAILVDLPGIIEDAHKGRGLGDNFLKHVDRVKALIHVVDCESQDVEADIETVTKEVTHHHKNTIKLPVIYVLNKIDLIDDKTIKKLAKKYPKFILTSANANLGLKELKDKIVDTI